MQIELDPRIVDLLSKRYDVLEIFGILNAPCEDWAGLSAIDMMKAGKIDMVLKYFQEDHTGIF